MHQTNYSTLLVKIGITTHVVNDQQIAIQGEKCYPGFIDKLLIVFYIASRKLLTEWNCYNLTRTQSF